jgi:surface carbohydrate biosynthesis protein
MRIAIPVEVLQREFDAKLYLSIKLAMHGHDVYLGRSTSINQSFDFLDPDIYISNLGRVERVFPDKIRAKILLLDSEGGFIQNKKKYSKRISPDRLSNISWYLAWGKRTAEIARRNSDEVKISVTGNPRFDLVQSPASQAYETVSNNIEKQLGNFILVNTNFQPEIVENYNASSNKRSKLETLSEENNNNSAYVFIKMLDMISDLAEKLEENIIIRPHPNNESSTYVDEFESFNNVYVNNKFNVHYWIQASQITIHNGCTTGIEAALMNRRVYAYEPDGIVHTDLNISNFVSKSYKDKDLLVESIENDMQKERADYEMSKEQIRRLEYHIANIDLNSADKIVEVIDSIDHEQVDKKSYCFDPPIKEKIKRKLVYMFGHNAPDVIRKTGITGVDHEKAHRKFPTMNIREFEDKVKRYSDIVNINNIQYKKCDYLEDTFNISTN